MFRAERPRERQRKETQWKDLSALESWKSFGGGRHSCGFAVTWSRWQSAPCSGGGREEARKVQRDLQQRFYLPASGVQHPEQLRP